MDAIAAYYKLETSFKLDPERWRIHDMAIINLLAMNRHFILNDDVLYNAIRLLDRYLVVANDPLPSVSLLFAACFALAANYLSDHYDCLIMNSEILKAGSLYLPGITKKMLTRTQLDILEKVDWKIPTATVYGYLQLFRESHFFALANCKYLCRSLLYCNQCCCSTKQLAIALAILRLVYNIEETSTLVTNECLADVINHLKKRHHHQLTAATGNGQ
jgi:hypothetical protein